MARKPIPQTSFYQINPGKSHWARIWLTDDGCLSIMSDFGCFSYWWGDPGCEFREFLTKCDNEYLSGKLGGGEKAFDGERTIQVIREKILYYRRHGSISKEAARIEWNRARKADDERGFEAWRDEVERELQYLRGRELDAQRDLFQDSWDFASYGPPWRLRGFMKYVWPLFMQQVKDELREEKLVLGLLGSSP